MPYAIGAIALLLLFYLNRYLARLVLLNVDIGLFYGISMLVVVGLSSAIWFSARADALKAKHSREQQHLQKQKLVEEAARQKEDEQRKLDAQRQQEDASRQAARIRRNHDAIKEKVRNSLQDDDAHRQCSRT